MPRRSVFALALAAGASALLAVGSYAVPTALAGAPVPAAPAGATASATISASPTPSFTALAFPAPSAGWVLGQSASGPARALIWHTSTAGSTWKLQWQGAGSPLTISATDPAHAWALIACPAHQKCARELLATADGGQRWRVAATLAAAVNEVQFYSPDLGIATSDSCMQNLALTRCPGQLLVSRDGGAHWTSVLKGTSPVFGTATAAGQLWAAQTYPAPPGKSQPEPSIRFLTSTDGGHQWRSLGSVSDLGPLDAAVTVTLAATKAGLTLATVYDQLSCAMHGCGVADLLSSRNGGRGWSTVNLADTYPDECGLDSILLSPVPGGGGWVAAGRNGGACAPPLGLLYRYPGPVTPWQQLTPWQLAQVSALAAVTGREAYAISDRDAVAVTFDAGAQWRQLLPAPAPSGQVDAVTATTALAAQEPAGAGIILRSDNAGHSWSQASDLPGVVTQLDSWSARDGVAATYQPNVASPWQLFESSDGGSSWTPRGPLPGGANTAIDGPWMSASGHGLLLTLAGGTPWEPGNGGLSPVRIWTTSDYGRHWQKGALLPVGGDSVGGPASFVYAGGFWNGLIVIANDTGNEQVAAVTIGGPLRLPSGSPPADNVQLLSGGVGFAWALNFARANLLYVVLYRTTDNGKSWQHISVPVEAPLNSPLPLLDFSDANHGLLVIGNATWRTANGGRTWTRS
jgi:photosystem II stability/assembly factor-like uncharacterized protein